MSEPKVVPIPLWRSTRGPALWLMVLGTLVVLIGLGLHLHSEELEQHLQRDPSSPPPPPRPSESSPPTTSS